MPELLTRKQYEKRKDVSVKRPPQKDKRLEGAAAAAAPLEIFQLIHPDGEGDFEDILILGGKPYRRMVRSGCCYTDQSVLKDFLVRKGWQLLGTKVFKKP